VFIKAFMVAMSLLFAGIGNLVYAGPVLLQDAYTATGYSATLNYGSSPSLLVSSTKTGITTSTQNSFLQFSVNPYVPTGIIGKDIAKATLNIFVNSVTTAGSFNVSSVTGIWSEETIKGNNNPVVGLKVAGPIAITTASARHWISIDITNQVKDWLDGIGINNGLALIATNGTNVSFDSKESAAFSQAPEIDIIMERSSGIQGLKGDIGPIGDIGAIGPIGLTGPIGPAGTTGATGSIGATGAQGPIGPIGPAGVKGDTGLTGTFQAGTVAGQMLYWNGTAWVNIPVVDRSATLTLCRGVPTWDICLHQIGDRGSAGGKVFYITEGGLHGLEAAPVDQANAPRGCYGTYITSTSATVGTGATNTTLIVASCAEADIAAKVADAYSLNGFNDWYLPSKDELYLLYEQKAIVGGVDNYYYWSSTDVMGTIDATYAQDFSNGTQSTYNKLGVLRVRAIRSF
ncbi:MAG: DNRLRE domain-containing protein, partial [Candidatus Berkelbacteria bacterium]